MKCHSLEIHFIQSHFSVRGALRKIPWIKERGGKLLPIMLRAFQEQAWNCLRSSLASKIMILLGAIIVIDNQHHSVSLLGENLSNYQETNFTWTRFSRRAAAGSSSSSRKFVQFSARWQKRLIFSTSISKQNQFPFSSPGISSKRVSPLRTDRFI